MSVYYMPPMNGNLGYWYADNPSIQDLEDMIFAAPPMDYYNFQVIGKVKKISPEWLAKHPNFYDKKGRQRYDYGSSYSIWREDVGDLLDYTTDVEEQDREEGEKYGVQDVEYVIEFFNEYLALYGDITKGKEWIDIYRVQLVDRPGNYRQGYMPRGRFS